MTLPLPLMPWAEQRFTRIDADTGLLIPNSGGFIATKVSGSSTDLAAYTNASPPLVAHTNPIELDSDGRPPSPIFLLGRGYKFIVYDENMVELYTVDPVEDVGATFLSQQGAIQGTITTATTSPYIVLSTDATILVDSATNPFVVQLQAAADRGTSLTVKNVSAVTVEVTPEGAETIDTVAAAYEIPAASSPTMPSIVLNPDGVSGYTIPASHGI